MESKNKINIPISSTKSGNVKGNKKSRKEIGLIRTISPKKMKILIKANGIRYKPFVVRG